MLLEDFGWAAHSTLSLSKHENVFHWTSQACRKDPVTFFKDGVRLGADKGAARAVELRDSEI